MRVSPRASVFPISTKHKLSAYWILAASSRSPTKLNAIHIWANKNWANIWNLLVSLSPPTVHWDRQTVHGLPKMIRSYSRMRRYGSDNTHTLLTNEFNLFLLFLNFADQGFGREVQENHCSNPDSLSIATWPCCHSEVRDQGTHRFKLRSFRFWIDRGRHCPNQYIRMQWPYLPNECVSNLMQIFQFRCCSGLGIRLMGKPNFILLNYFNWPLFLWLSHFEYL